MSLRTELEKAVPEVLRERYAVSDSQLRAAAQGALRSFGENVTSQQNEIREPAKDFVPLEVKEETVTLQNPEIKSSAPVQLGGGGGSGATFDAYVGVAGIVHLAHIVGTVDP